MYFQRERFGYSAGYEGSGGRLNKGLSMLCLVKIKMGLAPELAAALSDHCRLEHLHSKDWLYSNHLSEIDFAFEFCWLFGFSACLFWCWCLKQIAHGKKLWIKMGSTSIIIIKLSAWTWSDKLPSCSWTVHAKLSLLVKLPCYIYL